MVISISPQGLQLRSCKFTECRREYLDCHCALFTDVSPVDAFGTQEVIKQRLKRSVTDVEVKDGAEVEVATPGWTLLDMGMPILSILVVMLAFLVALPAAGVASFGLMFMCGGSPEWCDNPFQVLLAFLFQFITLPPMLLLQYMGFLDFWDF